jgi:exoribonuclease R
MTLLRYKLTSRNDNKYSILNNNTLEEVNIELNDNKLFSDDVFIYNKGSVEIVSSPTRDKTDIPAVLILAENKTYGRTRSTVKMAKLLYKCVPDDQLLPSFLVPYQAKEINFSKVFENLYVTIRYKSWTAKHPHAQISQIIGPVSSLDNFYEYQLYCKGIHYSLQGFQKETNKKLNEKSDVLHLLELTNNLKDRRNIKVFSIDPGTTKDYDDAFSIVSLENDTKMISVYIANVAIILDKLQLWEHFSERVSTIYLPNGNKPMLPHALSDNLCSLKKCEDRLTFAMDIYVNNGNIVGHELSNCLINISTNFEYESEELLNDNDYNMMFNITKQHFNQLFLEINDSHDLVAFYMILMNNKCGEELKQINAGICRTSYITDTDTDNIAEIKMWSKAKTAYNLIEDNSETKHEMLKVDIYAHITSPIRRLVDLLNMIKIQEQLKLYDFTSEAKQFYENWIGKLDKINRDMKSIRKVQNDCNLLFMCVNNKELLNEIYDATCIESDLLENKSSLYISKLDIVTRVNQFVSLYSECKVKLYLFNNEDKFKRKIRAQVNFS